MPGRSVASGQSGGLAPGRFMERRVMHDRLWFRIATVAVGLCSAAAQAGSSNCFTAWGGMGCEDAACSDAVCGVDPFCCAVAWDAQCASEAATLCGDLDDGGGGCVADLNGDHVVDAADLAIVLGGWGGAAGDVDGNGTTDGSDLAVLLGAWGDCPVVDPCGTGGDCCTAGALAGCNDATCCAAVCAVDPSCCSAAWDDACADEAGTLCAELCGGPTSNCCTAWGGIGCDDAECFLTVRGLDSFCCEFAWDAICAAEASIYCFGLCGGYSSCCSAWGGVGCDDPLCQGAVCSFDGFCCTVQWDGSCAAEAGTVCGGLCP